MADFNEMSERDVAEAFDVAVQDRANIPRRPPCAAPGEKISAGEATAQGFLRNIDDETGRGLTTCESDQIREILHDRLALKQIFGPIGGKMANEKFNAIRQKVHAGYVTIAEAKEEARKWLGNPTPSCTDRCERKAILAERCVHPKKDVYGADNRDACYEKLATDINQVTRQELYENVQVKNKARVKLNEAVDRYNCLLGEIPALEQERDRMKPTIQRKRDELVKLKTDLATWNDEKPRMENQLKDLTCLREEKVGEIARIREEIEAIKQNMVNHESAVLKLKCMRPEVQECYAALEKETRDYEEARLKREEAKESYSKMFATTKHLTEALLNMKYIPDVVRYFTEYQDNQAIDEFMFSRAVDVKRFMAVEAKIQHSLVLAQRLKQVLERFEQNERRVLKVAALLHSWCQQVCEGKQSSSPPPDTHIQPPVPINQKPDAAVFGTQPSTVDTELPLLCDHFKLQVEKDQAEMTCGTNSLAIFHLPEASPADDHY